jgi:hypothetical protein
MKNQIVRSITNLSLSRGKENRKEKNLKLNSSLIIKQQKNLKHLLNLKNFRMKLSKLNKDSKHKSELLTDSIVSLKKKSDFS